MTLLCADKFVELVHGIANLMPCHQNLISCIAGFCPSDGTSDDPRLGDGFCNDELNVGGSSCNYDGGDCCPGTCVPDDGVAGSCLSKYMPPSASYCLSGDVIAAHTYMPTCCLHDNNASPACPA